MFPNLLASLAGFPPAGSDVPVELHVTREGNRERWSRNFAGKKMVTVQWENNGALIRDQSGNRLRGTFGKDILNHFGEGFV